MTEGKTITLVNYSGNRRNTSEYSFLETAIYNAAKIYLEKTKENELHLEVCYGVQKNIEEMILTKKSKKNQFDEENRLKQYVPQEPIYTFERLIMNTEVIEELIRASNLFKHYDLIYNRWGLKANNPYPVVALNFFGPPGTGKTLAAHAIASKLGKKIILASYAQIENMYHGEAPKNVEAVFKVAEQQDAVLFIDEADSLLSKRFTSVQHGTEDAINAVRSQILICLEKFKGIVIFATNLVGNYDCAFESRVRSVEFKLPDEQSRYKIWELHLPKTFPQAADLDIAQLAKIDNISGREIRNAIQYVAEKMAEEQIRFATYDLLESAIAKIKSTRFAQNGKFEKTEIPMSENEKKEIYEVAKESGILE